MVGRVARSAIWRLPTFARVWSGLDRWRQAASSSTMCQIGLYLSCIILGSSNLFSKSFEYKFHMNKELLLVRFSIFQYSNDIDENQ